MLTMAVPGKQPPKPRPRQWAGVAFCLALVAAMTGCASAPATNTVVASARSPDGSHLALLVDRYYHAALTSDGFFLIVVAGDRSVDEAINARNIGDSAALVATWANKVKLHWLSDKTLLVICNSCGLKPIDIVKRADHAGSTKILYQGFPKHTAFK